MSSIDSKMKFARVWCVAVAVAAVASGCAKAPGASDYLASKDRIVSTFNVEQAKCDQLAGNAKDVCLRRAEGDQSVALAELEFKQSGLDADRAKLATAKSDAAYGVARELCDDQAGNAKDVCVKEADAARIKSDADTKLSKVDAQARDEAIEEKRKADYNVAIEKCDALAGASKEACVAQSKATYGQS